MIRTFLRLKKGIEDAGGILGAVAEIITASSKAVKTNSSIQGIAFKRELVERAWEALMEGDIEEFEIGDIHIIRTKHEAEHDVTGEIGKGIKPQPGRQEGNAGPSEGL